MHNESMREAEIDWADWFSTGDRALRLILVRIDPDVLKRAYIDAHMAGRVRGEAAASKMPGRLQEAAS